MKKRKWLLRYELEEVDRRKEGREAIIAGRGENGCRFCCTWRYYFILLRSCFLNLCFFLLLLIWTCVVMFPLFFYYSILLCFKILRGNVGEKSRGRERERDGVKGWGWASLFYDLLQEREWDSILSRQVFYFFFRKGNEILCFLAKVFFFFFGIQNNYSPRLQLFFFFFFYHL